MAASILPRLALRTVRLTTVTLCKHTSSAVPYRSFSATSCILGKKWFTEKHEWIDLPDNSKQATVGITDYAQESLGEIVYVELPELETELEKDDIAGCVESVKAASDIYCPVAGKITEVNSKLTDTPQMVNRSPLDEGWLFKLEVKDPEEVTALMDEHAYKTFCEENN